MLNLFCVWFTFKNEKRTKILLILVPYSNSPVTFYWYVIKSIQGLLYVLPEYLLNLSKQSDNHINQKVKSVILLISSILLGKNDKRTRFKGILFMKPHLSDSWGCKITQKQINHTEWQQCLNAALHFPVGNSQDQKSRDKSWWSVNTVSSACLRARLWTPY